MPKENPVNKLWEQGVPDDAIRSAATKMFDQSGQEAGSPPADDKSGQSAGSPPAKTEPKDPGAKKADSPAAEDTKDKAVKDEKKEEGKGEKVPYDQDPKWKAARAAEKRMNDLLEKHGFDSAEDLEEALASGQSLQEALGKRDANQLIRDSEELHKIQAFWAEEDAKKLEESETAEQTINRLKKEKADALEQARSKERSIQEQQNSEKLLEAYDETIFNAVDALDMPDPVKEYLSETLSSNNPLFDVDISDAKSVKKVAKTFSENLKNLLDKVRQEAIDDYASGKADAPPSPPASAASAPAPESTKEKPIYEAGVPEHELQSRAHNRIFEALGLMDELRASR